MSNSASPEPTSISPLDWWAFWQRMWNLQAPGGRHDLTQPILPGWTFGNVIVNERNSASPTTEREILTEASYGRQLGRLMEAVAVLVDERSKNLPAPRELTEFVELCNQIQAIKKRSGAARVEHVQAELRYLKAERPDDYEQIVEAIRRDTAFSK